MSSTLCLPAAVVLTSLTLTLMPAGRAETATRSDEYQDFNPGTSNAGSEWVQVIEILSPPLRSDVKGNVDVKFRAPGMTVARALCWQQPTAETPDPAGHDTLVAADMKLAPDGSGSFVFPADKYPNGPIIVRILANNADSTAKDIRELQLFNKGGVVWNQGIPRTSPAPAQGMKLVFADDFSGPLSISRDGANARYCSHKPGGGDFSGWPFSDHGGPNSPFSQIGTFLRIHASKSPGTKGSTGLLSPVNMKGDGVLATVPFYTECRFTAQSAPGTWAAFWTLTRNGVLKKGSPGDELDIAENYGGVGKGNPNHPGYSITSHFWHQKDAAGKPLKNINKRVNMSEVGNKSYWSTTFHTYGLKVTKDETTYYLDGNEMLKHPTGPESLAQKHFFMINYAIGGISGWKIDLEREGNASDMWVDYVVLYQGK